MKMIKKHLCESVLILCIIIISILFFILYFRTSKPKNYEIAVVVRQSEVDTMTVIEQDGKQLIYLKLSDGREFAVPAEFLTLVEEIKK